MLGLSLGLIVGHGLARASVHMSAGCHFLALASSDTQPNMHLELFLLQAPLLLDPKFPAETSSKAKELQMDAARQPEEACSSPACPRTSQAPENLVSPASTVSVPQVRGRTVHGDVHVTNPFHGLRSFQPCRIL